MRAIIFDAPRQIQVGAWTTPSPSAGEVRVAVRAVGICAGDMHIYQGGNPYANYPIIGGHEIAGTIDKVGDGVDAFAIGEHVVVEPFLQCGYCYPCRIGKFNCCVNLRIIGVHQAAGFCEFVAAPSTHVHRVHNNLSMTWASFAEPIAIAVQACRRAAVQRDEVVLIIGCGPIGLALIEVVNSIGARSIAVDTVASRLEMAAKLGATTLSSSPDLATLVNELTNGEGPGVVMEATGSIAAMEQAAQLVASGGRVVILGLSKQGLTVSLPALDLTRKEMTILGSRASVGCFPEALRLLASGAITYPRVATEFDMWDAPAVFAAIDADPGHVHKGVFINKERIREGA